jgi:hypothetical protein
MEETYYIVMPSQRGQMLMNFSHITNIIFTKAVTRREYIDAKSVSKNLRVLRGKLIYQLTNQILDS